MTPLVVHGARSFSVGGHFKIVQSLPVVVSISDPKSNEIPRSKWDGNALCK